VSWSISGIVTVRTTIVPCKMEVNYANYYIDTSGSNYTLLVRIMKTAKI
jgi:hypothetical protein